MKNHRKAAAVALSCALMALSSGGCREFNPPSDDELISKFYAREDVFNEMVAILGEYPYDSFSGRYLPFDVSASRDSLFVVALGVKNCARLDSLLKIVGCNSVSTYTSPASDLKGYRFGYYNDGTSISSSIEKGYAYILDGENAAKNGKSVISYDVPVNSIITVDLEGDMISNPFHSLFLANSETNAYRDSVRNNPNVLYASVMRHLKGNWVITFDYFR